MFSVTAVPRHVPISCCLKPKTALNIGHKPETSLRIKPAHIASGPRLRRGVSESLRSSPSVFVLANTSWSWDVEGTAREPAPQRSSTWHTLDLPGYTYQAPLGQASYQPSPSPQGFTARLPFWDNTAIADISLFCDTRPLGLLIERWNRRRVSCPEGLPSIEIAINTLSGDRLEGAAGYFVPSMFFAVGGPSRMAAPNSRSVGGAPNQRTNDDYLATITLNASINMETN